MWTGNKFINILEIRQKIGLDKSIVRSYNNTHQMGQGAHRMSARGLRDEIKATENQIRQQWHEKRQSSKNYLIDNISDEMAQYMKEKRLGKQ